MVRYHCVSATILTQTMEKIMIKTLFSAVIIILIGAVILTAVSYCGNHPSPQIYKSTNTQIKINIPSQTDWRHVDAELIHAVQKAHKESEQYADQALTDWTEGLMIRVDKQFIPWYFSYMNQTKLQLLYAWYWSVKQVTSTKESAGEQISLKIQNSFSTKVLRPEICEIELQNIAQQTVDIFVKSLHEDLRNIKESYSISDTDWNNYLKSISSLAAKVEAQRSVPILLKATTAASAFTTIKLTAPAISLITKKLAPKAVTTATGSAGKFASFAGKGLGTYIAIGFIAWDIIDHLHTKKVNAPILRNTIADYLKQVEIQLKQKIMFTVTEIENDLITTIQSHTQK
jgi:hypothetical protein